MNAAEVFNRITQEIEGHFKPDGTYQCRCPCPNHEDKNPSCNIKLSGDKILAHCFVCGEKAAGIALRERGFWPTPNTNFTPKPHRSKPESRTPPKKVTHPPGIPQKRETKDKETGKISDTKFFVDFWTYRDKAGKVLGHAVRYENAGKKEVVPFFHKNQQNNWYAGFPKAPRPLYGLNHLTRASEDLTIWIVEGEKCAEALQGARRLATTSMGGANAARLTDWSPLAGRKVRIWPDHDKSGEKYAEEVSLQLEGLMPPPTIEIVDVAKLGLEEKGDVVDWLQTHDKNELNEIPLIWEDGCSDTDETVENPQVEFISLTEISKLQIEDKPVIGGLLGEKESLIISALSGVGKSLLVNCMALSLGNPPQKGLWGLFDIPRPVKTLIVQSENSLKSFNMRLSKLFTGYPDMERGGENVFVVKVGNNCRYVGDIENKDFQKFLIDSLLSLGAGMLVLDPLISYHAREENDNSPMRKALDQFSVVLEEANVSATICHHCNKQGLTRGATAISDWADNMLLLTGIDRKSGTLTIKAEHSKCRNYEQQDTFYLERTPDLNFLRCGKTPAQANNIEVAVNVLSENNGFMHNQAEFKKAIMAKLNCSTATAYRAIDDAVKNERIIIELGKSKQKSYYLGIKHESL